MDFVNNMNLDSMGSFGRDIMNIILFPGSWKWYLPLKIVFFVFTLGLIIAIVYFLLKTNWLKMAVLQDFVEFFTFRPFGVKKIERDWNKTVARLNLGLESEYKLALIEADSMMDDILKRMGFTGETLGERLNKLTSATISNIEDIKKCHQTRNNIVHDPNYKLSLDVAKQTLASYEKAFRSLQAF
jgi:hypothetical protein